MSKESSSIGFGFLLIFATIIFTVLKFAGILQISWLIVTLPLWVIPAFIIACIGFVFAGTGFAISASALFAYFIKLWDKYQNKRYFKKVAKERKMVATERLKQIRKNNE